MNTKPKQGVGYCSNCSHMMNCDIDLTADTDEEATEIQGNVISQMSHPKNTPESLSLSKINETGMMTSCVS